MTLRSLKLQGALPLIQCRWTDRYTLVFLVTTYKLSPGKIHFFHFEWLGLLHSGFDEWWRIWSWVWFANHQSTERVSSQQYLNSLSSTWDAVHLTHCCHGYISFGMQLALVSLFPNHQWSKGMLAWQQIWKSGQFSNWDIVDYFSTTYKAFTMKKQSKLPHQWKPRWLTLDIIDLIRKIMLLDFGCPLEICCCPF